MCHVWQDIAIVEPGPGSESEADKDAEGSTAADLEPCHCVLLRAGGQMSVLDMAQGELALLLNWTRKCSQHSSFNC